jgi:hypothetical protein
MVWLHALMDDLIKINIPQSALVLKPNIYEKTIFIYCRSNDFILL